ncbi:MAG: SCO family protein [Chloroflexi bacterium]|nr:SCO family protein [Chloroflexota bacterium]
MPLPTPVPVRTETAASQASTPARLARTGRKLRLRGLILLAVAALALLVACRPSSTLPVLFPAPRFDLLDQTGRPFSSSHLSGKVVIANFIFTTCTDICPLLTATMSQVRDQLRAANLLGDKVVIVSFTVDPEHDTPDALRVYGERFGAVPSEWRFLTGSRAAIDEILIGGFKVGRPPSAARTAGGTPEIVHSNRVALIDAASKIRAFLNGEELDIPALVEEARRLAP